MSQFLGLSDVTWKVLNVAKWDKTLSIRWIVYTREGRKHNQIKQPSNRKQMIFHYFTFQENKLMKNSFQFLIS